MEAVQVSNSPVADKISLFFGVAKSNGSLLSVRELSALIPGVSDDEDLARAIDSTPSLRSRFELKGGFVLERGGRAEDALAAETTSRMTALFNLKFAAGFAPLMHSVPLKVMAVSGSSSYRSASRSKDLDIFSITGPGKLWVSVTQAMVLARLSKLSRPRGPSICLSCYMDEGYARAAYSKDQGALFARDALQTKVLRGGAAYDALLRSAGWMAGHFPKTYASKAGGGVAPAGELGRPTAKARVLNEFLFVLVGGFLKLKARLLNRKFAAKGRDGDLFEVRAGRDYLFYESKRYSTLRKRYSGEDLSDGPR